MSKMGLFLKCCVLHLPFWLIWGFLFYPLLSTNMFALLMVISINLMFVITLYFEVIVNNERT